MPPAMPAYRSAGAKAAGTGAVSPALPSGMSANDICILVAITVAGGSCSITANGSISTWTPLTGSPIDVTGGNKLYVWWGRYSSGSTAPTVTPGGDHCVAGIVAYSGCFTGADPIHVVNTGTETTSDTSFSFATGLTTTIDNCINLVACSTAYSSNTGQFSGAFSDANLSSINTRLNYNTNSGAGGGFGLAEGGLATAGAVGTWAETLAHASAKAYIAFALKPPAYYANSYAMTEVGVESLAKKSKVTKTITEVAAMTLAKIIKRLKTLSVVEVGSAALNKALVLSKTISITEISAITTKKLIKLTKAITETALAAITAARFFSKTLIMAAGSSASSAHKAIHSLTMTITELSNISSSKIIKKILSLQIVSVLSRKQKIFLTKTFSLTSAIYLAVKKTIYRTLAMTAVATITHLKRFNKFILTVETSVITLGMLSGKLIKLTLSIVESSIIGLAKPIIKSLIITAVSAISLALRGVLAGSTKALQLFSAPMISQKLKSAPSLARLSAIQSVAKIKTNQTATKLRTEGI